MRTEIFSTINIGRWLALAVVVVITAPVASLWARTSFSASDPSVGLAASPIKVTFLIETITVEGNRHFTSEIILSESLLREGREYSERQLREAVNRIVRLPLVLDAEFFLRKGSDRGLHTLVIEVEEASRWFSGFDIEYKRGDRFAFPKITGDSERRLFGEDEEFLFLGWRTAVGRNGVASVAAEASLGTGIQIGYTHYDLFGRGVRASANYRSNPGSGASFGETAISELDLGIPLKGNHSLNIVAANTTFRASGSSFFISEDATSIETSWLLNTLNDPVFPTSGRFVRVGIGFEQSRVESSGVAYINDQTERISAVITGDRYWRLSETRSLSGTFEIGTRQEPFGDRWRAAVGTQYAKFLWRDIQRPHWRELRWETRLEVAHGVFSGARATAIDDFRTNSAGLSTGLKFRSKSSILRLALTYQEVDLSR